LKWTSKCFYHVDCQNIDLDENKSKIIARNDLFNYNETTRITYAGIEFSFNVNGSE
jgi:hypothetical protein